MTVNSCETLAKTPAKSYAEGIGVATADRTINRRLLIDQYGTVCPFDYDKTNPKTYDQQLEDKAAEMGWTTRRETWAEVALRVAYGNTLLRMDDQVSEFKHLHHHLRQASVLMSGRHLQHGDEKQTTRPLEVFTNCSTSAMSFLTFYLLLNGSGVGRSYDDEMMLVDWSLMPIVVPVISHTHPDVQSGRIVAPERHTVEHLHEGAKIHYFMVPDSREGWAKAIEKIEVMTYQGVHWQDVLLLDFSEVRPHGAPIGGMQGRPASGPGPVMKAIENIARIRDTQMEAWRQAMYVDHYLAECVLVGGARRAARMSTKNWRDRSVLDFIGVKRSGSFLWSSNNSVTVDEGFWNGVEVARRAIELLQVAVAEKTIESCSRDTDLLDQAERRGIVKTEHAHAYRVLEAVASAAYHDGTGEPGLINQDLLTERNEGIETLASGDFAGSSRYQLDEGALELGAEIMGVVQKLRYKTIVNPCLSPSSRVLTPEGISTIGDIEAGTKLWSEDGWVTVVKKWSTGIKPVLRYRTSSGVFYGTKEHRVVCGGEKVEVRDAKAIDSLVGPADSVTHDYQTVMDGLVMGDGVNDHGRVVLYIGDNDQDYFDSEVASLISERKKKKAYLVTTTINSHELVRLPERVIPDRFVRASRDRVASFLRGLYSANGSVLANKGRRITLKTTCEKMAEQVQVMLSSLGIMSYVTNNKPHSVKWHNGEYVSKLSHDVNITSVNAQAFASRIGFIQNYKNEKVNKLIADLSRPNRATRRTFDIISVEDVVTEEVFDITVDGEHHTFWCDGLNVSNCAEIPLAMWGGYCTIADVVPYHAGSMAVKMDANSSPTDPQGRDVGLWDDDVEDAFRAAARALIRVNTMDSLYRKEVLRTNRIGVGMTGLHEYAWARFGLGFRDMVAEDRSHVMWDANGHTMYAPAPEAMPFWMTLARFSRAVDEEAARYSKKLGVNMPHTTKTAKPAGCRPWYALTTTEQGILTLEELFSGHREGSVWSPIEGDFSAIQDDGEVRPLTRTFDNGEAEIMQIRMAYGLTVESTRNHPWFVKERVSPINKAKRVPHNDWVVTEEIRPGDVLDVKVGVYKRTEHKELQPVSMFAVRMRGNNAPITQPTHMNPDLAWLLGYLWGDGATSPGKYRLRWLDRNTENLEKANRVFRQQFGIEGKIKQDPHKDARSLEIGSVELWHWLIKNDVFKYHAGRIDVIPRVVRESAQEDVVAFIAGLVDADGAIARAKTDKSVIFSQADYRFSRHVQDVAWGVGIAFGMSHNTCGENWQQGRKSMYLLTMSAATDAQALGLLKKHSNKMTSADDEPGNWRCDLTKHKRRTIGNVESVESIGVMPTYDVEVADNHWFYAGAVKSHNTTSKLFALSEGAHLPSLREYLRWVQFRNDDPLVEIYRQKGYPVRQLKVYSGTTIIGFPTQLEICKLNMGDKLVTAAEATPEEQYRYLRLLETFWIRGVNKDLIPLPERGGQVSYTLKYDPSKVSFGRFKKALINGQSKVRCCSVMPQVDMSVYEYQPEEPVSKAEYELIVTAIQEAGQMKEDIGREHVDCASGACPISFNENSAAA